MLSSRKWNWLVGLSTVAVLAATAGVLTALLVDDQEDPVLFRTAARDVVGAAAGPDGNEVITTADPAVVFPLALEELPGSPTHLAVDPSTGDLWFLLFTYDGVSNTLYHYSRSADDIETFDIPSSTGTELYYAIQVDSRSHVIIAEGTLVTDFDPGTESLIQFPLEEPTTPAVTYVPGHARVVLDMTLGEESLLYLSRMNVPAITEFNVTSGESREFPYSKDFGPAYDIEFARGQVWLTSRWNIEGISTGQTGRIDLRTGAFSVVGAGTTALGVGPDGVVHGIRASSEQAPLADVVDVKDWQLVTVGFTSQSDKSRAISGLGILDYTAVDPTSGDIWFVGGGSSALFSLDPASGASREFQLPIYRGGPIHCPPPNPGQPNECPNLGELYTTVRGLAVAPNGDVYFSDATMSRIGVVLAGQ